MNSTSVARITSWSATTSTAVTSPSTTVKRNIETTRFAAERIGKHSADRGTDPGRAYP